MNVKTGFWQEKLADGTVADSFVRLLESFMFGFLCAYTFFSFKSYELHFEEYTKLLRDGCLTEQGFNMLIMQLKQIDWNIFWVLVMATVAPKVIQKFAETKAGIKDTSESTVTTIQTDKSERAVT
jgi:hypothetical protein